MLALLILSLKKVKSIIIIRKSGGILLYISFLTSMYRSIKKCIKGWQIFAFGQKPVMVGTDVGCWWQGRAGCVSGDRGARYRDSVALRQPGLTCPAQADQRSDLWLWPVSGELEWTSGACCSVPTKSVFLWEITRWLTNTSTTPPPQTTSVSTTTAGGGPLRGPSHIPGAHTGQYLDSCMWISESVCKIGVSTGVDNPLVPHWRAILAWYWYCDQGDLWLTWDVVR